jgi:hypothetical protein
MSIFGSIMSAIFGSVTGATSTSAAPAAPGKPAAAPSATPGKPMSQVDVAEVMDNLADESDEDLDWRKSIVDLMKLLKLDSSLTARKQLATELGYTGNMSDSASMNIWLHKQVMIKLAENGGNVPADLAKK